MNSNILSPIHEDYPYGNVIGRWKRDGETYININYSDNGHAEYKTLTLAEWNQALKKNIGLLGYPKKRLITVDKKDDIVKNHPDMSVKDLYFQDLNNRWTWDHMRLIRRVRAVVSLTSPIDTEDELKNIIYSFLQQNVFDVLKGNTINIGFGLFGSIGGSCLFQAGESIIRTENHLSDYMEEVYDQIAYWKARANNYKAVDRLPIKTISIVISEEKSGCITDTLSIPGFKNLNSLLWNPASENNTCGSACVMMWVDSKKTASGKVIINDDISISVFNKKVEKLHEKMYGKGKKITPTDFNTLSKHFDINIHLWKIMNNNIQDLLTLPLNK